MMNHSINFSAGPSMLPLAVKERIAEECLNWRDMGVSVMEISHRSDAFLSVAQAAMHDLKTLLSIPDHYRILFLPGGAQTQYAAIPMNLLAEHPSVAYAVTGLWGKKACEEASRYATTQVVCNSESSQFTEIQPQQAWHDFSEAAYLHYVDNETINGIEFSFVPVSREVPLVCDMSSNLLSRPIDVSQYGLIYASAQKNAGIAGITIVIIREDLLTRTPMLTTPSMLTYSKQETNASMLNTPPTFPWYVAGLVFQWLKEQGGVSAIAAVNHEKAKKLYDYIDQEAFYTNPVSSQCRSRMNVVFYSPSPELDALFAAEAGLAGLIGLKGHRLVGGIRASIYNAMPMSGVDALIDFMKAFVKRYG